MAITVQTQQRSTAESDPNELDKKDRVRRGRVLPDYLRPIPTLVLDARLKNYRAWILSSGLHTGVLAGGFLEETVALAGHRHCRHAYPVVNCRTKAPRWGSSRLASLKPGRP